MADTVAELEYRALRELYEDKRRFGVNIGGYNTKTMRAELLFLLKEREIECLHQIMAELVELNKNLRGGKRVGQK